MVLHVLYIVAFTILAVLAMTNLIRNLITLGTEVQKPYSTRGRNSSKSSAISDGRVIHPELLDESGKVIDEPLLVMRSMTVEDARERLDFLYESSPGPSNLNRDSREDP
jgi:hypothetical protein